MKENTTIELKILKGILWVYIILCIVIASLNYGYASRATPAVASFITWFWHFYENWVKTIFIIVCSFLTLRIIGTSKRTAMRKRNLIGFIVAAFVVHIAAPFFLNNSELYFFAMPLPWTTAPLQLLNSQSTFYMSRFPVWGSTGVIAAIIFYVCFSVLVILGTLLFGRRWQCSTLCLFNGFASEVFAPAIPLIGKAKKVNKKTQKFLSVLRWVFLVVALFFTLWWVLFLFGKPLPGDVQVISKIENYKYLSTELLMAMFFWVAFIGRGYCHYCPLGTVLGLLGKVADQKITTDNTKCVQCSQCNLSCPMSIDIKNKARNGEAVSDLRCVGCGHCVDACPTRTLSYSTRFLDLYQRLKNQKIQPKATVGDITQPDVNAPDVNQPDVNQPDVNEPDVNEPDVNQQDANQPETNEPDINEPDVNEPDVNQPDVNQPDINEPDINEPDINEPDANQPETNEPDV